jgi:hypothetical protein
MKNVRLDSPLNDFRREIDPFRGEHLDQGFRDDTPAHVAAGGARFREVARLVNVNAEVQVHPPGEGEQEVCGQRSGRSPADDGDP